MPPKWEENPPDASPSAAFGSRPPPPLAGRAEKAEPALVEARHRSVGPGGPHELRHGIGEKPPAPLALAQLPGALFKLRCAPTHALLELIVGSRERALGAVHERKGHTDEANRKQAA